MTSPRTLPSPPRGEGGPRLRRAAATGGFRARGLRLRSRPTQVPPEERDHLLPRLPGPLGMVHLGAAVVEESVAGVGVDIKLRLSAGGPDIPFQTPRRFRRDGSIPSPEKP